MVTVGGFPASRGKREIRMRENSRGNYNAGNAGKLRTAIQGGDYVLGHQTSFFRPYPPSLNTYRL